MTDNEIIKALECCTKQGCSDNETKECPLKPYEDCSRRLAINALVLINRQKAEIESLKSADVAPVIRCKDCVLHGNCGLEDMFALAMINAENAFCCIGERKDNDNG